VVQEHSDSSVWKNLCLLVVFNGPLIVAWLNTLNNQGLYNSFKQDGISDSDLYTRERCWKPRKGLRVWDVMTKGKPQCDVGLFDTDIVLITASELQITPEHCWVNKVQWDTILADEGHEFLRGQHNAKKDDLSLSLQNWKALQHKTESMFIITGTPFVTKISYDFVAIARSIAKETTRAKWGPDYTDAGLEELMKGWISKDIDDNNVGQKDHQERLQTKARDVLALFTLRRDENSKIRGRPVIEDYFAQCQNFEDPLVPANNDEFIYREELYKQHWAGSDRWTQRRNDNMHCLSYCYRFVHWAKASPGKRKNVWDGYSLQEARRQIRTNKVINILQEGKRTGNGVVLFVQRTFLAELCLKVCPFHNVSS